MSGLLECPPPDVAIAIEAGHVAAARLAWRGGRARIAALTVEPLSSGVVVPALATSNIVDSGEAGRAVAQALGRLGRVRRVALVVPDPVAKVSLIRFETVPARSADLNELVRWQMRKSAPFPLDQALVSLTPGARSADGGQEFVVSVARRDIVEEYEHLCAGAGAHAGLVDLATFSVINSVLASGPSPGGDWLLVHVTPGYTTLAVLRGAELIFFRSRADDAEGTLADVVHQTAMYYEDRLKGAGFSRVLVAGAGVAPDAADDLRQSLAHRLGLGVEAVDPRSAAALGDRAADTADRLDALTPLVGVLLRERKAA